MGSGAEGKFMAGTSYAGGGTVVGNINHGDHSLFSKNK